MDFTSALLLADETLTNAARLPGFLGTRGSFMLDFVFVAMFGILLVMGYSIYLVKYRQRYELHKRIQVALGLVLLVAVVAFEVDMRFFTDWETLAKPSPFYNEGEWDWVWISLTIHLLFAIPTTFLWTYVIISGLRNFPSPAQPSPYSPTHLFWAKLAAFEMLMTSVTGWVFYILAFAL